MCDKCINPQTVWDKETVRHTGMCEECYQEDTARQVTAFLANQDAESYDSQLLVWDIPF